MNKHNQMKINNKIVGNAFLTLKVTHAPKQIPRRLPHLVICSCCTL